MRRLRLGRCARHSSSRLWLSAMGSPSAATLVSPQNDKLRTPPRACSLGLQAARRLPLRQSYTAYPPHLLFNSPGALARPHSCPFTRWLQGSASVRHRACIRPAARIAPRYSSVCSVRCARLQWPAWALSELCGSSPPLCRICHSAALRPPLPLVVPRPPERGGSQPPHRVLSPTPAAWAVGVFKGLGGPLLHDA